MAAGVGHGTDVSLVGGNLTRVSEGTNPMNALGTQGTMVGCLRARRPVAELLRAFR